ncbi:MAG TPA: DUF2085 domain-containing protein, partial [Chloroflexota bacterium]|nr:DUF2085 domain-containing protein [Chloroflexota bacterium]
MTPGDPEPVAQVTNDPDAASADDALELSGRRPTAPPPSTRLLVSALLTVVAFFAIYSPWPLIAKLRAAGAACCAQIPSHTIMFQGRAMPIDSRNSGIYLGVLLVIAVLWVTGRQRAALYVPPGVRNILMLCVLAMILDGFNSVAASHHLHTYYQDTNTI